MKKLLLVTLLLAQSLFAITADEIAQKVDARYTGDTSVSTMKMILIDKHNNKRIRSMKKYLKEYEGVTKSVIFFLAPADVRNTAFLTFDYADASKDDDQWLYLPALKKSKRIASSDKSASFMGSDFTYSDMTSRDISQYRYKIAKEASVRGHKVWIMESVPKTQKTVEETGYKKSYMFVRQDNFVVVRAIHITTEGTKKYLDIPKLKKIDGIWTPLEISMTTKRGKKTLHKTILQFSHITYNKSLSDAFLTIRRIEKGL